MYGATTQAFRRVRVAWAPHLKWAHWRGALRLSRKADNDLCAPWRGRGHEAWLFSRGTWAIELLGRLYLEMSSKRVARVFLPAYFCREPVAALRNLPVEITFYPVTDDLAPDWDVLSDLGRKSPPDLFLLTHYFGFPAPIRRAAAFCRRHSALLIEDGAHALAMHGDMGRFSWAMVFSPYKTLPLPDGGVLSVNRRMSVRGLSVPWDRVADTIRSLVREAEARSVAPAGARWLLRKAVLGVLDSSCVGWYTKLPPTHQSTCAKESPDPLERRGVSRITRGLLEIMSCELAAAGAQRRRNFRRALKSYQDGTITGAGTPVFSHLPPGVSPYAFVVRSSSEVAERIYQVMNQAGVPVAGWPDLPPQVADQPDVYPHAHRLRNTLNLMPVHQSLGRRRMDLIIAAAREAGG